ncbi:UNVERIFIED_CONTAM: hypothetical protein FKN15_008205 [Acipenser sinensis]
MVARGATWSYFWHADGAYAKLAAFSIADALCLRNRPELLEFPVKGQFEVSEGTPNGLKSQEPHPQEPQPESPAQTEEGQDQEQGQPAAAPQKEEPDPTPTETHLSAEDMRRARRIRNAALQHLFIRKTFRPFKCSQCGKAFRDKEKLEQHLHCHGWEGNCPLTCNICNKGFLNSSALDSHMKVKKHMRSFHSEKVYQCTECDKAFCRPDKLRLHMLRHSDIKDFLCSTCGKQFKRKDKLREHMQRMHNPERERANRTHRTKTFKQKIPADFESYMFKCRVCMMGFRRRGMLVNHLSKRHPEMRIDEVPELTLPIIKPNRDYFCQYCDKVYKSASKRKAHILKNHPGSELPPSIRKLRPAGPGEPDPMLSTHTQLTGTIATAPVCCPHCSKQYSSKTKMVQHIRKKHPEFAQLANAIPAPMATAVISGTPTVITTDGTTTEAVVASSPHQSQHSTVDVSQLHDPHSYTQHAIQVQHIQVTEQAASAQTPGQVAGQPLSPSSQQNPQELSPVHMQSHALQSQQQGAVQHTYLPSTWNSFRNYSSEIQMMAIPHTQYVIAEAGAPVSALNSGQVKAVAQQTTNQQQTTQYIITTTTNGNGNSEVHITKP